MSGYKTFAIWGAGNQGLPIINAFLALKATQDISVTVLTRPESKDSEANADLAAAGACIVAFDVSSPSAASSLIGVDVFVTTISGAAVGLQPAAARAAVAAGVKLFVPANWGVDIWGRNGPWHRAKQAAHVGAQEAGIPMCSFLCGIWTEWLQNFGFNVKEGRITVLGNGKAKVSTTSKPDVARYVVHALTTFPADKLKGGEFYIQGDCVELLDLANEIKKISPKPIEISTTGREYLKEKVAANPNNINDDLALGMDEGMGQHQHPLGNDLWPEWKPQSASEVFRALLSE